MGEGRLVHQSGYVIGELVKGAGSREMVPPGLDPTVPEGEVGKHGGNRPLIFKGPS